MTLPGGHETVGAAYVRILADGSGLDRSIRDEFKGTDDAFREQGRRHHQAYEEGFNEEQERHPVGRAMARELNDDMRRNKGKFDAVGQFLGGRVAQNMRRTLREELGSRIGNDIFNDLQRRAFRAGSIEPLLAGYRRIGPEIAAAVDRISREEQRLNTERQRAELNAQRANRERILRAVRGEMEQRREVDRTITALRRLADAQKEAITPLSGRVAHDVNRRFLADIDRLAIQARRGDRDALARLNSMHQRTERIIHDGERGFLRLDGLTRQGVRRMSDMERSIQRVHNRVRDFDIGRMFGKGSRNDFFNLLGAAVGGLAELAVKAALLPVESIVRFGSGLRNAAKEGHLFQFVLNSMARGIFGLVKVAGAAFLGLNAIYLIAGPLAAAVSMLGGAVAALSASLAFGLIGAIGALLPIMGVFAVGIGVVASAFAGMQKKQKDALKQRMGPLVQDFKDLRKVSRDALFSDMKNQVPALHRLMTGVVQPLFRSTGRAIATSITSALRVLDGPTMRKNFAALQDFAPLVIRRLGRIFTNTFASMTGIMRAGVPVATQFLNSLVRSSREWARFINSTRGQNRIRQMFEDGWHSARILYRVLRDVVKVVRDIFSGGRETGDSMFLSLARQLERFDRYLRSSRGREAMAGFFADVERFWGFLGRALGGLGRLFGGLDNSDSRHALNSILTALGDAASLISDTLPYIASFQRQFFGIIAQVADEAIKALKPLVPMFNDIVHDLGGAVISTLSVLAKTVLIPALQALASFTRFIAAHENVFGPVIKGVLALWLAFRGFTILRTAMGALTTFFTLLPTRIGLATIAVRERLATMLLTFRTGIGRITRAGRGLGALGLGAAGAGLLLGAPAIGDAAGGGTKGKLAQGAANILGGTAIGAAAGSVIPGVGTGIGAGIGAAGGALKTLIELWPKQSEAAKRSADETRASVKRIKDATDELAASIRADNNNLGELSRAAVADKLSKGQLFAAAQDFGIDIKTLTDAMLGNQRAAAEVAKKIPSGQPAFVTGPNGALTPTGAKPLSKKQQAEVEALNRALGEQAKSLRNASIREDEYAQATLSAGDATKQLALRSVTQQVARLGHALDNTNPSLNKLTAEGRDNARFIQAHLTALGQQAAAYQRSGGSAAGALAQWRRGTQALRDQLIAAGFNKDAVDRLIRTYGKVPAGVITHMKASDAASPTIRNILERLGKVPPSKRTQVIAEAQKAISDLEYIRRLMGNLDGASVRVHFYGGGTARGVSAAAHGMVVNGAKRLLAGEAGPEAIVPLRRPLSQVDPSVKALSAFAQGLPMPGEQNPTPMARGGIVGDNRPSVVVESGAILVQSPNDPTAVAIETLNRLAGKVHG